MTNKFEMGSVTLTIMPDGDRLQGAELPPKTMAAVRGYDCPKCDDTGKIFDELNLSMRPCDCTSGARLNVQCNKCQDIGIIVSGDPAEIHNLHSAGDPCDCKAGEQYR